MEMSYFHISNIEIWKWLDNTDISVSVENVQFGPFSYMYTMLSHNVVRRRAASRLLAHYYPGTLTRFMGSQLIKKTKI